MKRLWIGVAILLVLLVCGIGFSMGMGKLHDSIHGRLMLAAEAAGRQDMAGARQQEGEARQIWRRWRCFSASLADHEPLEQIDSLFEELELYSELQLPLDYAAACVRLAEISRSVSESHSLTWWNFL